MNIEKLLEERNETHGNHVDVYNLVWKLWEPMMANPAFKDLPDWMKVELMMISFKQGRAIHKPHEKDNMVDVQGYAGLILQSAPVNRGMDNPFSPKTSQPEQKLEGFSG